MKQLCRDILAALLLGVVFPSMAIQAGVLMRFKGNEKPVVSVAPSEVQTEAAKPERSIYLRMADGSVERVDLEEYLVGAVLAEMPASFEPEALKAQAVAARTYAWKNHLDGIRHLDASLCTDSGCCQAYISEADYLDRGGSFEAVEKVRRAVSETEALVLTYNEELIEATYFSCSGGRTEDALAVWGNAYPYLVSVDSPGEEAARYYMEEKVFTRQELETLLDTTLPEDPEFWFADPKYTAGGGVDTIRVGSELFSGTMLRSILGLRSTAFSVKAKGDSAVITTRGYGHRVGMSQYGADAMAASGEDFRAVLLHYYPGTALTSLD